MKTISRPQRFKIDCTRLEQFRASLPEEFRYERFRFLHLGFDIVKARFLVKELELPTTDIDVAQWAAGLGLTGKYQPGNMHLLTGVEDARAMRPETDLRQPLLVVCYRPRPQVKRCPLLIDGNHRLRKAFLKRIASLSITIIPEAYLTSSSKPIETRK